MIVLTLWGQVPAQKNGKMIAVNRKTGRPFIASNARVKEWQESAKMYLTGHHATEDVVQIEMQFWNKDARKRDIDNMMSSVLDALKNSDVIKDDNCFTVKKVSGEFMGVDKNNPRVEILIKNA